MEIQLKDFIAETINQIIDGVISAQEYAKEKNARVTPRVIGAHPSGPSMLGRYDNYMNVIDFDIAVTAVESAENKSGAGVLIAVMGASLQGQTSVSSSTLSRIKFVIPVELPKMDG